MKKGYTYSISLYDVAYIYVWRDMLTITGDPFRIFIVMSLNVVFFFNTWKHVRLTYTHFRLFEYIFIYVMFVCHRFCVNKKTIFFDYALSVRLSPRIIEICWKWGFQIVFVEYASFKLEGFLWYTGTPYFYIRHII